MARTREAATAPRKKRPPKSTKKPGKVVNLPLVKDKNVPTKNKKKKPLRRM